VDVERGSFYRRALERLLADGALTREMSVLVTCGGDLDRDVFRSLGFAQVTITNLDERLGEDAFAPYTWSHADAEALPFPDGSFDWTVVSAGLHHCRSPHRAVLELYRVARKGILGLESRDSASMRLAATLRLVDDYEVTAVAAHDFLAGGVANTAVPNYVYRWTERELEKTIASFAPHAQHRFLYLRELEIPWSVVEAGGGKRTRALRVLLPLVRLLVRFVPSQANLFAFAVLKPEASDCLQPWLRRGPAGPEPDVDWIRSHYAMQAVKPDP
jgi:SAM-dependent methyltransferase